MKNRILMCLFLALAPLAAAQDKAPAAATACATCHGAAGVSINPEWPNLAGQHELYLRDQITAFRDGVRENPVMWPFVKDLKDSDIAELAAYYAAQPRAIAANGDSSLVAKGETLSAYCKACHGMWGVPAANEWPILAGQHATYLAAQLGKYKSGERVNSHMQAAIARLGEPEFAALAAYYSQLQP